jgi:hypothetical protein
MFGNHHYQVKLVTKLVAGTVPEGLNDRSLAAYCQEYAEEAFRPARDGMISSLRLPVGLRSWNGQRRDDLSVRLRWDVWRRLIRYPPDRNALGHIPGSKLPGYRHLLPVGRKHHYSAWVWSSNFPAVIY